MLKTKEDDTNSFRIVSKIYDFLLLHHGVSWNEFNMRWKSASAVKKALADKVVFSFYSTLCLTCLYGAMNLNINFSYL